MAQTPKSEYESLLLSMSDYTIPNRNIIVPEGKPIYHIDWSTRAVETPTYLSVQNDHYAETVYFRMDRFFGRVDLSTTIGIIQYRDSQKHEYIYVIPYYDVDTYGMSSEIIFPWQIQGPATKYSGTIEFSFKFFLAAVTDKASQLNDGTTTYKELVFDLNTLPATSQILKGWQSVLVSGSSDGSYSNAIDVAKITQSRITVDSSWYDLVDDMRTWLEEDSEFKIYWSDAGSDTISGTDSTTDLDEALENSL